ncbi:sugar ABC transporter permease [Halanaerobium salsuginis]|jgi:arabinogalactan oligomer/maltooligosaccharide transport system permease protein|uniref:Carbohydrate ABC transporter membrane protein 2, CUT1 family (TC 3.A.1.1.-) n=1 Tax=Halanaerobium salsuginis TaxID=29563 RepID=A0A1I4M4C4_9FIRM|nr:sugar ABC transporter permease [Halanaerobium salsuginis]SFL97943.1 carbohydrate ABC transporter membrane protein 2, CUT1 family (TC 3.A.1.1.-) [Halanaerobium salsuginis]
MSVKKDSKLKKVCFHLFLIISVIIALYPALRVFGTSLRPDNALHSTSLAIIPKHATFAAYKELIFEKNFLIWLRNSFLVTLFTVIVGVSLAATAGYVFSRKKFPGRKAGLTFFLITQMFPSTMLLLPMYLLLAKFGLTEQQQLIPFLGLAKAHLGLIIMYSSTALPLCVWQMKGYYDTIPESLEEAALVDGLNQFQAFYKIILPLAKPALVITALFSFMTAWNEYMVARVVMTDNNLYTLPVGLTNLAGQFNTAWSQFAAASVMIMLPVMAIFLILSRYLVGGLTLGGVKG